jgi:hypothetical protein
MCLFALFIDYKLIFNYTMENKYPDTIYENQFADEEDINFDELTSHKIDKNTLSRKNKKKLIVILEHAYIFNNISTLELLRTKKEVALINSDDHYKVIKSKKKSLEDYRPDVTHQVNTLNPSASSRSSTHL